MALDQIKDMIDPEKTGFITFANLTVVMEDKLKETDTVEDLLEQLKKLDRDGDGKIPSPEFKQYLMNMGVLIIKLAVFKKRVIPMFQKLHSEMI